MKEFLYISWPYLLVCLMGLGFFRLILFLLPRIERRDVALQKEEVLKEAHKQREIILQNTVDQAERTLGLFQEDLEAELAERMAFQAEAELELQEQRESFATQKAEVLKLVELFKEKEVESHKMEENVRKAKASLESKRMELRAALEGRLEVNSQDVLGEMVAESELKRKLAAQKSTKTILEDFQLGAKRKASRSLARALARYEPNFHWPKPQNTLECTNEAIFTELSAEGNTLISMLEEISGVEVKFSADEHHAGAGQIRTVGGFGKPVSLLE